MERTATGVRPLVALVAGLVVGVAAVAGLAAAGWPDHDGEGGSAPSENAAAARAFVDRWRASRLGTWVVEAEFVRVMTDGRRLATDVHMAQRPPDRLVTGLGTVDRRKGADRLACSADADGVSTCRSDSNARPFAAEVEDDIDLLRGYVLGPKAFYGVRVDGADCFVLRLRRAVLTPPYGQRARFCFDPATNAPVWAEVRRKEATDRTVAVEVRSAPTDVDLDPDRWGGGGRG
jgi:hypothetical protein